MSAAAATILRWAYLPVELLKIIGEHLDSRVDVFRFRAVCSSWRSSIPPSLNPSNLIPFNLPPPIPVEAFLSPVTFCRLEFISDGDGDPLSPIQTCLTKVDQSIHGDIHLVIPLSNRHTRQSPPHRKTLNSLNCRFVELTKGFNLKLADGRPVLGINKVVPFSDPNCLISIFYEGKLGYCKIGQTQSWMNPISITMIL
ncbi:hypothetical protein M5689_014158 [Euphorbia peplus]|nr:hypothetical protein M5689_014158 [Euphorbia peplus]